MLSLYLCETFLSLRRPSQTTCRHGNQIPLDVVQSSGGLQDTGPHEGSVPDALQPSPPPSTVLLCLNGRGYRSLNWRSLTGDTNYHVLYMTLPFGLHDRVRTANRINFMSPKSISVPIKTSRNVSAPRCVSRLASSASSDLCQRVLCGDRVSVLISVNHIKRRIRGLVRALNLDMVTGPRLFTDVTGTLNQSRSSSVASVCLEAVKGDLSQLTYTIRGCAENKEQIAAEN